MLEKRSLNLSSSVAIVISESIRQTNYLWMKNKKKNNKKLV